MNISENKLEELYSAVKEPIIDLRIKNSAGLTTHDMDMKLFYLEIEIFKRIKYALNIK